MPATPSALKETKQTKSEKTKEAILAEALRLFQADGVERVTMRALAEACGLSLGAFYYHFRNKEEIVLEFYRSSLAGHVMRTRAHLGRHRKPRLHEVMTWICRDRFQEFEPFRPTLRALAQRVDPADPASPWHESSQPLREQSVDLFEMVAGACLPLDAKTRRLVARGLWLHHLLLLGFWLFDRTEKQKSTEDLLRQSTRLWKSLPGLVRVPGAKSALSLALQPLARFEGATE